MVSICVVSRGDLPLFPATQGASVKLYYTLKSLSELGAKVYFVSEKEKYLEVVNGKFKEKNYPKFLEKSMIRNYQKTLLSFLGIPKDIHVLYHPLFNFKLWLKLLYVVLKEKVDAIQAEFTCFGIPAVFAKILTHKPLILVEHNVETFQLPRITNLGFFGREIVRFVEKTACFFSDKVIVMCKEEKKRLIKIGVDGRKIRVIPHGVDLEAYRKVSRKTKNRIRKKYKLKFPTLIFHGTFSYKPNYEAIKIIEERILPQLKKKIKNVKVLAIGNFPPKDVKDSSIIFTGPVRKLQNYIKAADIAIVPIMAGGGIRMKILEYFASKIPVISTKKGAEGIPAKNGKEIIIAPIEDFPREIIKLVKSKERRKKLVKNAFKFVQKYDWKKIGEMYLKEIYLLKSKIKK